MWLRTTRLGVQVPPGAPMKSACLFCTPSTFDTHLLLKTPQFWVVEDRYPVNPGHALIIPIRHSEDMFELTQNEWDNLYSTILATKELLDARHHPDGYNIGANCQLAAGQTVFHTHIHVIPRYAGDVENPRGGVRQIKSALVPYE